MPVPSHRPNRLVNEKSPYLLQHAYNPVDWHAWNEEAFEEPALKTGRSFCPLATRLAIGAT